MNKNILYLFICFFVFSCKYDKYEEILNDFSINSFYVCLNIQYDTLIIPIVIQNSELYSILCDFENITENDYINKIDKVLSKKINYKIDNYKEFLVLNKYEVFLTKKLISKNKLIETFFNENGVLKTTLTYHIIICTNFVQISRYRI